jgi:hypothetical protein
MTQTPRGMACKCGLFNLWYYLQHFINIHVIWRILLYVLLWMYMFKRLNKPTPHLTSVFYDWLEQSHNHSSPKVRRTQLWLIFVYWVCGYRQISIVNIFSLFEFIVTSKAHLLLFWWILSTSSQQQTIEEELIIINLNSVTVYQPNYYYLAVKFHVILHSMLDRRMKS